MHLMNPRTELAGQQGGLVSKQNVRLLVALSILVVALVAILVKDWDFWFGSEQTVESAAQQPAQMAKSDSTPAPAKTAAVPVTRVAPAKTQVAVKNSSKPAVAEAADANAANAVEPIVATNRVVLPPLDVDVVAGDSHRTIRPGSNATKVEIPSASNRTSAITATMTNLPTSAAGRERLSTVAAPELRQSINTTYPLLGQHSRVQGSVVLQAVVGADGTIENLSVVSGPAILVTAAQQAVREWHFKPYLQNGQPVETKALITVNFTIRVSGNPESAS